MNTRTKSYLKDLRRSRFFLPGLAAGAMLGAAAGWTGGRLFDNIPQFKFDGSTPAATNKLPGSVVAQGVTISPGASVVFEGDSLTYGLAGDFGGSAPPINGSTLGRIAQPFPELIAQELARERVAVINHGFPGDTVLDGLSRWKAQPDAALYVIMYGTNDAGVRGGAQLPLDTFEAAMEVAVRRRMRGGVPVLLLAPPSVSSRSGEQRLSPYRAAVLDVATRTGASFIDGDTPLRAVGTPLQFDGVHLTQEAHKALAEAFNQWLKTARKQPPAT